VAKDEADAERNRRRGSLFRGGRSLLPKEWICQRDAYSQHASLLDPSMKGPESIIKAVRPRWPGSIRKDNCLEKIVKYGLVVNRAFIVLKK